jgi:hypothetical protein
VVRCAPPSPYAFPYGSRNRPKTRIIGQTAASGTRPSMAISRPPRCECHPSATPGLATPRLFGHCPTMQSSSECVWTVSRVYRGHRIVAVQLDGTWHIVVHGYTGAIARTNITSLSLAEAMDQAEWVIETRLAFRPPAQRKRMPG